MCLNLNQVPAKNNHPRPSATPASWFPAPMICYFGLNRWVWGAGFGLVDSAFFDHEHHERHEKMIKKELLR